jgi:hypothetical protein
MGNSLSCGGNMGVNTKMVLFWSHESPHLGLEYLDPSINQINILITHTRPAHPGLDTNNYK